MEDLLETMYCIKMRMWKTWKNFSFIKRPKKGKQFSYNEIFNEI